MRPPPGEPEAALLLGVARQESMFNTWGSSHAGAQGLLQLMPRTALSDGARARPALQPGLLTGDPDYNIRLGSHYLKTLLERYDGEAALAVAAYNAGPGRVDEWLRLHGDPRRGDRYDLIDWVELIPFDETRNYVQRVLEGAQHVPPPAGRAASRDGLVPAGQRPARPAAGAAAQAARRRRAAGSRSRPLRRPGAAARCSSRPTSGAEPWCRPGSSCQPTAAG